MTATNSVPFPRATSMLAQAALLGFLACWPVPACAQSVAFSEPNALNRAYQSPGLYGTAWGWASYGIPLNHSEFSSPYGAGFANGYAPTRVLPGPYGRGLWGGSTWIGSADAGYLGYRTFAFPHQPGVASPRIGLYAPALAPPILVDERKYP